MALALLLDNRKFPQASDFQGCPGKNGHEAESAALG